MISLLFVSILGTASTRWPNLRLSKVTSFGRPRRFSSLRQCSFSKDSPAQSLMRGQACLNSSIYYWRKRVTTVLFYALLTLSVHARKKSWNA